MGHARALINIENADLQLDVYNQIVLNGLSVREAEDMARGVKFESKSATKATSKSKTEKKDLTHEQKQVVADLRAVFNTKVQITRDAKGKGKIVIPFKSDKEFERILDILDA